MYVKLPHLHDACIQRNLFSLDITILRIYSWQNVPIRADQDVGKAGSPLQCHHGMKSAFVYSEEFSRYELGPLHPFKTSRAKIVYELCQR